MTTWLTSRRFSERHTVIRDQRPKSVLLINTDDRGQYGVQFGVLTDTELAHVSRVLGRYSATHTGQVQLIAEAAGKCPNCGTDLLAGGCPAC